MSEIVQKTSPAQPTKSLAELDPCQKPQSAETTRFTETEDACDDGVK